MALTAAQKLSCFEILRVSRGTTAHIHNGFGDQLELTELYRLADIISDDSDIGGSGAAGGTAGILDTLPAALVTKIGTLVTAWDALGPYHVQVQGGSSGAVTDSEKQREEIRLQLMTYVPVIHIADALKRKRGPSAGGGAFVPISR